MENQPELFDDVEFAWEAFCELSRSRHVGWDVGPLAPNDIVAWISLHVDDEEYAIELYKLIGILDVRWLELERERQERKKKDKKKNRERKEKNKKRKGRRSGRKR